LKGRRSKRARDPFTMLPQRAVLFGTVQEQRIGLDPEERIVLLDLGSRYNGFNNGKLSYSTRDAARAARVSPNTGLLLLAGIEEKGYIALTRAGSFVPRRAREWRLMWLDAAGRAKPEWGRMLCLPHWLLQSPAWAVARVAEKAVMLEFVRRYDGNNNGTLSFGMPHRGYRIGLSRSAIGRALVWLQAAGFLIETMPASTGPKANSRRWLVTIYPAKGKREASKEFMKREPPAHPIRRQKSFPGICRGSNSAQMVSVVGSTPKTANSGLAVEIGKTPAIPIHYAEKTGKKLLPPQIPRTP
jgi:hypothetical protein